MSTTWRASHNQTIISEEIFEKARVSGHNEAKTFILDTYTVKRYIMHSKEFAGNQEKYQNFDPSI